MQRAFVITLDLPADLPPEAVQSELEDAIAVLPYEVVSINLWDSPSASPQTTFPIL